MTATNSVSQRLNIALCMLKAQAIHNPNTLSICFALQDIHRAMWKEDFRITDGQTLFDRFVNAWPEYSGKAFYPVAPYPGASYKECFDAFWYAKRKQTFWDGDYGASRMRLLDYLIEQTAQPQQVDYDPTP